MRSYAGSLLVLIAVGCSRQPKASPEAASSASVVATPSVSAPPPPAPSMVAQALFSRRATLVACFETDGPRRYKDAGSWTQEERQKLLDALRVLDAGVETLPGSSLVLLDNDDCAKAFGDRLELASCSSGGFVTHYYSFELLENDLEMRDCLQGHGNWSALPHDSQEYHRAHLRYEAEKAQKLLEKMK